MVLIVAVPMSIWAIQSLESHGLTVNWKKNFAILRNKPTYDDAGREYINNCIYNSLKIMDTTAKWYTDENEANRELVTSLKIQGLDAEYQPRLPNGITADARVNNVIIEGKLSPNKSDIDRLIGQLTQYVQYSVKVNIVIYGALDNYAKLRIINEIRRRYSLNRVFINYLDNPQRNRRYY